MSIFNSRSNNVMGTWGTGLYQNDVSEDIKSELIDMCRRGHTIEEATELLIKGYAEYIEDEPH